MPEPRTRPSRPWLLYLIVALAWAYIIHGIYTEVLRRPDDPADRLHDEGISIQATVSGVARTGSDWQVVYGYRVEGRPYSHLQRVSSDQDFRVGQNVDILYLADDPRVAALVDTHGKPLSRGNNMGHIRLYVAIAVLLVGLGLIYRHQRRA